MSSAWIIRGTARALPLADQTVQAVVTSPPYFGLRSYGGQVCTWADGWRGELGSEPTPGMFVAHLVEVFAEVKRVLRDDGVVFCNIGDSYAGSGKGPGNQANGKETQSTRQGFVNQVSTGRPKSLLLVPERLAIALSDDGWIIRSRIAWCKAAPMPESTKDRPTSAWEHIWVITKRGKYYWDQDAVREPNAESTLSDLRTVANGSRVDRGFPGSPGNANTKLGGNHGRNLWNYWVFPPDPYPGSHFATFPRAIPERCIKAATSEYGACAACGAPWGRTTELSESYQNILAENRGRNHVVSAAEEQVRGSRGTARTGRKNLSRESSTTGWARTCNCGPEGGVRPCVVLDPFSGSGTTACVAANLGRCGVGVELSAEYIAQTMAGRLAQGFLQLEVPA